MITRIAFVLGSLFLVATPALGGRLYVVGDTLPGTTGFDAPSLPPAIACKSNISAEMRAYLAAPTTEVVKVAVSQCGSYRLSDIVSGLEWIQSDADALESVTVALALPMPAAYQGSTLVASSIEWLVERRAVVVVPEGVWNDTLPKGVLVMPRPGALDPMCASRPECECRATSEVAAWLIAGVVVSMVALGMACRRTRPQTAPPLRETPMLYVPLYTAPPRSRHFSMGDVPRTAEFLDDSCRSTFVAQPDCRE